MLRPGQKLIEEINHFYIKACDLVFEKRSEKGFDEIISVRDNSRKEMFACFRDVLTNKKGVEIIDSGVEECVDEY